jgi:hypothetical protein
MSHLSKIELEIHDLASLKEACKSLKIKFCENKKTFKWYSGNGQCDHAIHIPGAAYEVGINKNKGKYELQWDDYVSGGLTNKLGKNAGLLKQAYAVAKIIKEAHHKKYRIKQQSIENGIQLVLS